MELKKYLMTAKKDLVFTLAIGLIVGLAAFLSAPRIESGFRSQKVFYLSNLESQPTQGYNFSGYFTQSTAINETDTAVAILQSPDFQALLPKTNTTVTVRKLAPQVIQVTVISKEAGSPKQAVENLPKIFNQKMRDLNPNGPTITLNQLSDEVIVSYRSVSSKLVALAGFIFGIVFAFLILGIKNYLET